MKLIIYLMQLLWYTAIYHDLPRFAMPEKAHIFNIFQNIMLCKAAKIGGN